MLFIAVMYSKKEVYKDCKKELIKLFGDIAKESKEYSFDKFTDYYKKEMGSGLVKRFIVFNKKINKKGLSEIRILTGKIEDRFRMDGKRRINLDPGYINNKEVVLASVKKKDFKEELGNNVYAHKVLEFKDGNVISFWHTFPDYRIKKNLEFFINLRK